MRCVPSPRDSFRQGTGAHSFVTAAGDVIVGNGYDTVRTERHHRHGVAVVTAQIFSASPHRLRIKAGAISLDAFTPFMFRCLTGLLYVSEQCSCRYGWGRYHHHRQVDAVGDVKRSISPLSAA